MASDLFLYNSFRRDLFAARVRLDKGQVACLLVESYIFDPTHKRRSDITGECRGAGYNPGGRLLPGQRLEPHGAGLILRASGLEWSPATITVRGIVVYLAHAGPPGSDELIGFRAVEERGVKAGKFSLAWPEGVLILE